MCLGFVFVAQINDSCVYYCSRMRTGTLSLYLKSICSTTFNHFHFIFYFTALQTHQKREDLIAVKNKPNFRWLKTLTYANKCIFLIKKQPVKLFLRRRQKLFFSGVCLFIFLLLLSAVERHHIKCLFGRPWVMASAD